MPDGPFPPDIKPCLLTRADHALRKNPWVFWLFALSLLILREPESWFAPRFWAEDAPIYLKQSWELGGQSLWALQAGYVVLLQRLLALLIAPLPAAFIPAAYNFSAWALTLMVIWKVSRLRIASLPCMLLALCVAIVPENGEVFGTLTNIQWLTALLLVLLPLQNAPETRTQAWEDAICFIGAALTGPYIVLTWPLYLARVWQRPHEKYSRALLLGASLGAAVQAMAVVISPPLAPSPIASALPTMSSLSDSPLVIWPAVIANRLFGGLFFAQTFTRLLPRPLNALLGLGFILGLLWLIRLVWPRWSREERFFIGGSLAALISFFAVTSYRFVGHTYDLLPFGLGERYFVLPRILLLWVLVVAMTTLRPRNVWSILAVLLLSCSWGLTRHYRYHFVDDGWSKIAARLDAGQSVHYMTNPAPMSARLRRPRSR